MQRLESGRSAEPFGDLPIDQLQLALQRADGALEIPCQPALGVRAAVALGSNQFLQLAAAADRRLSCSRSGSDSARAGGRIRSAKRASMRASIRSVLANCPAARAK